MRNNAKVARLVTTSIIGIINKRLVIIRAHHMQPEHLVIIRDPWLGRTVAAVGIVGLVA